MVNKSSRLVEDDNLTISRNYMGLSSSTRKGFGHFSSEVTTGYCFSEPFSSAEHHQESEHLVVRIDLHGDGVGELRVIGRPSIYMIVPCSCLDLGPHTLS